jgi:hypothetical protein
VSKLLAGDTLEETIHFGHEANAKFTYALQQEWSERRPAIQLASNKVTVRLPSNEARAWGVTDQVGIAANIDTGRSMPLALLIEKDFACLDRSEEENHDTFPNPNAGAAC